MKQKKLTIILIVLAIIVVIVGSTFAYFTWATNASQNTAVTFTVTPTFSCSADGGGNITSQQKQLAPAACTNSTYAIQRTITTNITNSGANPVRMNMNLKINSINSNLSSSANFKYAITSSSTNCTTGVIKQGTFQGKAANDTVTLLEDVSSSGTYYLWIWLDAAETNNNTQDQSFNFSLDGSCTDEVINYAYTVNLDNILYFTVWLGQPIPYEITTYNTPEAAMAALGTEYSNAYGGATASLPFFLRHRISDGTLWCATETYEGESSCIFESQSDCNSKVLDYFGPDSTCEENTFTDGVSESYVGFVVTPAMAAANPGMTAGTYYLKGGDDGRSFLDNAKIIYDAFGGINCGGDSNLPATYNANYNPSPATGFGCNVADLGASADSSGAIWVEDRDNASCRIYYGGDSDCGIGN